MVSKMKIGILGTCPVCEGEFKVRTGTLVHHGFKRPGDGVIHGDCFAVGYEPYERSTKGCQDYKNVCLTYLANSERELAKLPSKTFFSEVFNSFGRKPNVRMWAVGVTNLHDMERKLESEIQNVKRTISMFHREIARMDKLIAAWVLKDLKEVTEEAASAQLNAERAARKAERDAKNAVKAEKAAALQAKRDAKAAEKAAFIAAFVGRLVAVKGDETKIRAMIWELNEPKMIRKYGHMDRPDWEAHEQTLIGLGLVKTEENGFVNYRGMWG